MGLFEQHTLETEGRFANDADFQRAGLFRKGGIYIGQTAGILSRKLFYNDAGSIIVVGKQEVGKTTSLRRLSSDRRIAGDMLAFFSSNKRTVSASGRGGCSCHQACEYFRGFVIVFARDTAVESPARCPAMPRQTRPVDRAAGHQPSGLSWRRDRQAPVAETRRPLSRSTACLPLFAEPSARGHLHALVEQVPDADGLRQKMRVIALRVAAPKVGKPLRVAGPRCRIGHPPRPVLRIVHDGPSPAPLHSIF